MLPSAISSAGGDESRRPCPPPAVREVFVHLSQAPLSSPKRGFGWYSVPGRISGSFPPRAESARATTLCWILFAVVPCLMRYVGGVERRFGGTSVVSCDSTGSTRQSGCCAAVAGEVDRRYSVQLGQPVISPSTIRSGARLRSHHDRLGGAAAGVVAGTPLSRSPSPGDAGRAEETFSPDTEVVGASRSDRGRSRRRVAFCRSSSFLGAGCA